MMPEWLARRAYVLLAIGAMLVAAPVGAQEMEIPVGIQIPLFLKVIAFDRHIEASPSTEVVMVVAFQKGYRQSNAAKDEVMRVIAELPASGRKNVRSIAVDLDREDLRTILRDQRATMLYVAPLRGVAIDDIAAIVRAAKVTTFSGVPKYITQGLAVGVRRVGERPKLIVNLRVARLEGADFSAEFLKLVQVVQ